MIKPFSDRTTPLATALVLCIGSSCALGGDPGHSVGGANQEVILLDPGAEE